jgi:hypothetical protein
LPGSTRSGEKASRKSSSSFKAGFFDHRLQNFVGRSRISRRFENNQLPAPRIFFEFLARRQNIRHIRVFGFSQRRRNADDNHVAFFKLGKIRRRFKFPASSAFWTFSEGTSTMCEFPLLSSSTFFLVNFKTDGRVSLLRQIRRSAASRRNRDR